MYDASTLPYERNVPAIGASLTKINIATQLNKVFTAAIRRCLADDAKMVDPRRYGAAGRRALAEEVARLLGVIET